MKTGNYRVGYEISGGFKDIDKYATEMSKLKIQCPYCGHKVILINKVERNICSWCRNYVYKDEVTKFKYKMMSELRKVNNEK